MDHRDLDAMAATLRDWLRGVRGGDIALAQDAWTPDGIWLTDDGPLLARDRHAVADRPCPASAHAGFEITSHSCLGPGLVRLQVRLRGCAPAPASSCCPLSAGGAGVIVMRQGPDGDRAWRICLAAPCDTDDAPVALHDTPLCKAGPVFDPPARPAQAVQSSDRV